MQEKGSFLIRELFLHVGQVNFEIQVVDGNFRATAIIVSSMSSGTTRNVSLTSWANALLRSATSLILARADGSRNSITIWFLNRRYLTASLIKEGAASFSKEGTASENKNYMQTAHF